MAILFCMSLLLVSCNPKKPAKDEASVDPAGLSPVTVTNPVTLNYSSAENSFILSGGCTNGTRVDINGDATINTICVNSVYSFIISKSVDGNYSYSLKQSDIRGGSSIPVSFSWVRATPSSSVVSPTVTYPNTLSYSSGESTFTLTGGCTTGNTVGITGDLTQSTACVGSAYSFVISQSVDGTYSYNLKQADSYGNNSSTVAFSWTRNTVVATPTITIPTTSPKNTNLSSLTISGACITGDTVNLNGSAANTMTCASGAYSFTVNKAVDSTYAFTVSQTDPYGNTSATASQSWIRDTAAPAVVTISAPAANPYTSSGPSVTVTGSCENNAMIYLAGDDTQNILCSVGLTYSFTINKSLDAAYHFTLYQVDLAGNSSAAVNFDWTLNAGSPSTPTITTPAVAQYYTNTNSITIAGACTNTYRVNLNGDSVQNEPSCAASAYSFNVTSATDGTYNYTVSQTNVATGNTSSTASVSWIRDTVAPAGLTKASPATNPYYSANNMTISGACENAATVYLSGDDTQNVVCASNSYIFSVVKSVDGTYNFSVKQTDRAGNNSTNLSQQWIRDSTIPATPTITAPVGNPYVTNNSVLTVAGGCVTGYTVTLAGVSAAEVTTPSNSLTQVCTSSAYSFTVTKSVDGTFNLSVKQTSLSGVDSGAATKQWVLDRVVPNTTLSSTPTDPNLGVNANFSFTSDDGAATFECKLDTGSYAGCTTPQALSSLSNGSYTFSVRAKDAAGNTDLTPATFAWTQNAGNAITLYHFDSGAETLDSGTYTGPYINNLTNSGASFVAGKFANGIALNGTSQYMQAAHTDSLALLASTMTLEAQVKIPTLPSSYMTIVSKMGAAPNMGWEFGIKKQGGANYRLYFKASLDGSAFTEVTTSGNLTNAQETALSSGFSHLAVTWNKGTVQFFFNGTLITASGTIGTVGSAALYNNTGANLYIGRNGGATPYYLGGSIDEVRISQILRWTAGFTAPTSAYSAD